MGDASHLGSFIRECRKGLKYTSRQVAKLSSGRLDIPSISNSYLISVENGKHIPRLDKVITLADVLHVPVGELVQRCREDLQSDGPPAAIADFNALFEAGREHAEMNEHGNALALFRQAYQVVSEHRNGTRPDQVSELRLQIANCYRRLKMNRVAKEELENLLRLPDLEVRFRARAAFLLAELYREEGGNFLGTVVAREALKLAIVAQDEVLEGKLLSTIGTLAAEEGHLDEALICYRDASAKLRKLGHERAALLARTRQGLVLVEKREYFKAIELMRADLAGCQEHDPYVRGWLHIGLSKAFFGAENYKSAKVHARSAKDCAERLENAHLLFLGYFQLWLVARVEKTEDLVHLYGERLRHYRGKIDVNVQEFELFDRLQKRAAEKAVEKAAEKAAPAEKGSSQ
jgi:transcriptional regulator with XRE-family HTH domain